MSIVQLELAASLLDDLTDEVVFVGGATVALWITDPAAPEIRPTKDVDVIVEVATLPDYYRFGERLRRVGFIEDRSSEVICRWRHESTGLLLDAMPAVTEMLGFTNQWHEASLPFQVEHRLPSGARLQAVPPPYLLATKIEAFKDRGMGDFWGSRDFHDIIALIDGRKELVSEVGHAATDLRMYIANELEQLMKHSRFDDGVYGALQPDVTSQARAKAVIFPRLHALGMAR